MSAIVIAIESYYYEKQETKKTISGSWNTVTIRKYPDHSFKCSSHKLEKIFLLDCKLHVTFLKTKTEKSK